MLHANTHTIQRTTHSAPILSAAMTLTAATVIPVRLTVTGAGSNMMS